MKIDAGLESVHLIHLHLGEQSLYLTIPQAENLMKKLQEIIGHKQGFHLQVQEATAKVFECSVAALRSASRERRLVEPRWIAYRIMEEAGMAIKEIGMAFNRDRGTVEHGLQQLENLISTGQKPRIEECKAQVKALLNGAVKNS